MIGGLTIWLFSKTTTLSRLFVPFMLLCPSDLYSPYETSGSAALQIAAQSPPNLGKMQVTTGIFIPMYAYNTPHWNKVTARPSTYPLFSYLSSYYSWSITRPTVLGGVLFSKRQDMVVKSTITTVVILIFCLYHYYLVATRYSHTEGLASLTSLAKWITRTSICTN